MGIQTSLPMIAVNIRRRTSVFIRICAASLASDALLEDVIILNGMDALRGKRPLCTYIHSHTYS